MYLPPKQTNKKHDNQIQTQQLDLNKSDLKGLFVIVGERWLRASSTGGFPRMLRKGRREEQGEERGGKTRKPEWEGEAGQDASLAVALADHTGGLELE